MPMLFPSVLKGQDIGRWVVVEGKGGEREAAHKTVNKVVDSMSRDILSQKLRY